MAYPCTCANQLAERVPTVPFIGHSALLLLEAMPGIAAESELLNLIMMAFAKDRPSIL